jgi:hypothetical protein
MGQANKPAPYLFRHLLSYGRIITSFKVRKSSIILAYHFTLSAYISFGIDSGRSTIASRRDNLPDRVATYITSG